MLKTPSFIINEPDLIRKCESLSKVASEAQVQLLYSIKAMSFVPVLNIIKKYVAGFSTSSLFESKLAQYCLNSSQEIHHFSVAYILEEMDSLLSTSHHLTLNTLNQLDFFHTFGKKNSLQNSSLGLRVNPEKSSQIDERYDPCRENSKLGVPLSILKNINLKVVKGLHLIKGLHIHTTCECEDYSYLYQLVKKLHNEIPHLLKQVQWINLGGGYLFERSPNQNLFFESIKLLKENYNLKIIIEPGTDFVQECISLQASVLDIQENKNNNKSTAILNSSINHLPEVYEYLDSPDIIEGCAPDKYPHQFHLAGLSCLAGDIFGDYSFKKKLLIGDKITFTGIGAYSMVKANRFNGINFPSIYLRKSSGEHILQRNFTFEEFLSFNQPNSF